MRITHQMISRNYLGRMETNLGNFAKSTDKMSSNRNFMKSWENVSDAAKALRIRKMIADNDRQLTTVRDAEGRAAVAEEALRGVNELLIRAEDRVVEGLNGTMSPEDRQKIATELSKMQEEVFQIMNTNFGGKYVFAAAGNADGSAPFTRADDGELFYQGYAVDGLVKNPANGNVAMYDGAQTPPYQDIKWNADNYVDIGYGFRLGANGRVDPNTAFKDTYSGASSFGFGFNADGTPLNAYSLLGSMVKNLNNNDVESLGDDLDAIKNSMEYLLTSITEVGTRTRTLEDTGARLEEELVNLYDRTNELEYVDLSREIINNKSFETSWQVTLQMGSRLIPPSIFDFIR